MCAPLLSVKTCNAVTRVTPRDLIILIKSPLHSLRVQSWTTICLLIFLPDESKHSVGDDAYERRDNLFRMSPAVNKL